MSDLSHSRLRWFSRRGPRPARRRPVGLDVDRRPTALVLKTIIGWGWSTIALGQAPLPGSLSTGPDSFGQLAAGIIVIGCIVSVVGIAYGYLVDLLDGLTVEALGLVCVAIGTGMYAYALWQVTDFNQARGAFYITLGVSVFAAVQYLLIALHRRRTVGKKATTPQGVDGGT